MTNTSTITELLRILTEENDFLNLNEPELMDFNQSPPATTAGASPSSPLQIFSSPSSVSSSSTVINEIFRRPTPFPSPVRSSPSSSSPSQSPSVISLSSSPFMPIAAAATTTTTDVYSFSPPPYRLLSPQYDSFNVTSSPTKDNDTDVSTTTTSELVNLSPQSSEMDTTPNILFQYDIPEEMYNDTEFLAILQEWYKETQENHVTADTHQINGTPSIKRKHE